MLLNNALLLRIMAKKEILDLELNPSPDYWQAHQAEPLPRSIYQGTALSVQEIKKRL